MSALSKLADEVMCAIIKDSRTGTAMKMMMVSPATDAFRDAIEDALREAASRLQAPAVAEVEVKPLEWGSYGADTPFGSYTVAENFDDKWEWTFHRYPYGSPDDTVYDTEAEARQAAQSDYERRIRSALRTGGSE